MVGTSGCSNIILAGDLNSHFERQTRFTSIVMNELDDLELSLLWHQHNFAVDYTHSQVQNDTVYFSTIDHFALSSRVMNAVIDGGVKIFVGASRKDADCKT